MFLLLEIRIFPIQFSLGLDVEAVESLRQSVRLVRNEQMSMCSRSTSHSSAVVLCDCGIPSPLSRSRTRKNPGRRFYGCKGRREGVGLVSYGFFRWYDDAVTCGWQHFALIEAQSLMEEQRHKIGVLKAKVSNVCFAASRSEKMPSEALEKECESLMRDVVVLKERCIGLKNVIAAACVVFGGCLGVILAM